MERVTSVIGFDLAERRWVAYCIEYDLDTHHLQLSGSWEQLIELCENYLDWCLAYGVDDLVTPREDDPLRRHFRRPTHVYDVRQIAGGIAQNEGRLLLDEVPSDWGAINTTDARKDEQ